MCSNCDRDQQLRFDRLGPSQNGCDVHATRITTGVSCRRAFKCLVLWLSFLRRVMVSSAVGKRTCDAKCEDWHTNSYHDSIEASHTDTGIGDVYAIHGESRTQPIEVAPLAPKPQRQNTTHPTERAAKYLTKHCRCCDLGGCDSNTYRLGEAGYW